MSEKTSLEDLRRALKKWEAAFVIVHQRKPNKEDLTNAPPDIKEKYRLYYEEKKGIASKAESSITMHEAQTDGVWGVELNKKNQKYSSSGNLGEQPAKTVPDSLDKLGAKLFQHAKSSPLAAFGVKKKPCGSFQRVSHNRSSTDSYCKKSSPPGPAVQLVSPSNSQDTSADKVPKQKLVDRTDLKATPNTCIEDSDLIVRGGIFKGAERFLKKAFLSPSASGQNTKPPSLKPRLSFLSRDLPQIVTEEIKGDGKLIQEQDKDIAVGLEPPCSHPRDPPTKNETDIALSEKSMIKTVIDPKFSLSCHVTEKVDECYSINTKDQLDRFSKSANTCDSVEIPFNFEQSSQCKMKPAPVSTATRMFEFSDEYESFSAKEALKRGLANRNKFHEQERAKSPPPSQTRAIASHNQEKILSTVSRKRKAVFSSTQNATADEDMQSLEKPEQNSNAATELSTISNRKPAMVKTKPAMKKSSATLSENFVSLNMKKKGYRRKGAAGLTGAQLRRKQWKQKMSARSTSYGTNKCFKCGGEGHWANKCKGKGVSKPGFKGANSNPQPSSYSPEQVEEDDFPTLRQAALMARGTGKEISAVTENGTDITDIEASIMKDRWEDSTTSNSQAPSSVKPLSSTLDNVEEALNLGLRVFGFSDFRPGQKDSIMRILDGMSTLVVLSTGAGKSLCYQLPAYLYAKHSGALTVVVSPLVSLMEDQITGLPAGVHGACLHSNMAQAQRDSVISALKEGKVHFLLVSPEALVMGGSAHTSFPSPGQLPPIAFACIDEAHCLSEWSHNFRPSYLRLCKILRSRYGVKCFLGLTATATRSTARDVANHLNVGDDQSATIRGAAVPPNLILSASRDELRDEALINLLHGERFRSCPSIIIYCSRREQTTRVATLIRTSMQTEVNLTQPVLEPPTKRQRTSKKKSCPTTFDPTVWTAESYHAGLSAAKRKSVQKAFMSGRLRVVVATVAFGMGLDKSDVRAVIHYSMAKSFEAYVQEIGRAGRDGQTAHCHVFLDPENKDLSELRRHTFGNSVDRSALKKLVSMVFSPCRCSEICRKSGDVRSELTANKPMLTETDCTVEKLDGDKGFPEAQQNPPPFCRGHERALSIESTVKTLDIKEEGVATLLCYLELHYPNWLELFTNVYGRCNIRCYGGPAQLQAVAKKCPPVAVAIARQKLEGKSFSQSSELEFMVIEVCDAMGWDSGLVKRELRSLQWNAGLSGFCKSGVLVELSDLSFHFRAHGDLTHDQVDEVLEFLTARTRRQEQTELWQLDLLATALRRASHKNSWMCCDEADLARSEALKKELEDFFDVEQKGNGGDEDIRVKTLEPDSNSLSQLHTDIRQFISIYGHDHALTGRSVARVFHGIDSPNFPAETWGRVRRFWRAHLHVDFPVVVREATKMVVAMR